MDFREPRYRREVFLRFYEFHLRYKTHPGCVYLAMPSLAKLHGWDAEQRLWYAYINGNTQNPVTSWLIFRAFPSLRDLDKAKLAAWYAENYERLAFDTDRRYFKKSFLKCVDAYRQLVLKVGYGTQEEFFHRVAPSTDPETRFRSLWEVCNRHYVYFGRLSVFSYLEYLRVMGEHNDCGELFLHDMSGSKSHRNGLAKVLGRDDWDWHDSNPTFTGDYSAAGLEWLAWEGATLLQEARERLVGTPMVKDVGYFTLESALCTYKSWHRPNRRYPNVYADMMVERIRTAERAWGEKLEDFWAIRREGLPAALLLENNPRDPGVVPLKQNWYRNTGEVVAMDIDWPCFQNGFAEACQ